MEDDLNNKFSTFINGIFSLIISQVLIKIFGVIYSLYLTNKTGFGDEGNAIYMSGYQIYALLLTISSIGVPNAIAKLVSEKKERKDFVNLDRIFKVALLIFGIIGFLGGIILFFISEFIAKHVIGIDDAVLSIKVLSPAIFFVSIVSVIKGYFNGIGKIIITAKIQFLEQVIKTILTIIFVEITTILTGSDVKIMAGAANFATTIATFVSLVHIYYLYSKEIRVEFYKEGYTFKRESLNDILNNVLNISLPMTFNAILSSFGKNIDSATVTKLLKNKIGESLARKKYGIISSKIDILISMPLALNSSISTALIPEISKMRERNDIDGVIKKIELSLLITLLIAIPYSFGLFFYSRRIFEILFPNALDGDVLLKIGSFGVVFSMVTQTINAILQGLGKNKVPVYASLFGVTIKLASNLILIPTKGIFEKGAIIGNVISSISSFLIVSFILLKTIYINNHILNVSLKIFINSFAMIFVSNFTYLILKKCEIKSKICSIISIGIAVIAYILGIFLIKIIKKDEICKKA